MMAFLLDLTGAHTGYIATLMSRFPGTSPQDNGVDVLVFPMQLEREGVTLPRDFQKSEVSEASDVPKAVMAWIGSKSDENQLVIGSFRPEVWSVQYMPAVANRPGIEIHTVPKFVSRYLELTGQTPPPLAWNEQIMPMHQALDTLSHVLRSRGGSIRKTQLRPALERENSVFLKSNPLTANPRVIGSLVEMAESRGLITLTNNQHNDPLITLNGNASSSVVISVPAVASPTPIVHSFTHAGVPADGAHHIPKKQYAEKFSAALEGIQMGPFPNLRTHFYKSLERRLEESLTVDTLVSRCIADTRAAYVSSGNLDSRLPWQLIRRFFERLLTRAKVLISEGGTPLWPSFEHVATRVAKLVPSYELELEGALVLYLLDEVGQIDFADVPAVTGSLFLTRGDNDRTRLIEVLSYLDKNNRIALENDHYRKV